MKEKNEMDTITFGVAIWTITTTVIFVGIVLGIRLGAGKGSFVDAVTIGWHVTTRLAPASLPVVVLLTWLFDQAR